MDISWYKTYFRPYELENFAIIKEYAAQNDIPRYERWEPNCISFQYGREMVKNLFSKLNPTHYKEKTIYHDPFFSKISDWYIEGFFQSEKYFEEYMKEIREDFKFIKPLSEKSQEIKHKIKNTNSVGVHIRRGDYLLKHNNKVHWICDLNYYHQALKYLQTKEKNLTFFFFSDDINRTKEKFKLKNSLFIDRNTGINSWQDMCLMGHCKHNIIANSSFSWRGAWLNSNPKKIIIAPKKWFADIKLQNPTLIPNTWICF